MSAMRAAARRRGRIGDFDIMMLVVAVVVGLMILVIGIQVAKITRKGGESVGSDYQVKEGVAYSQLKLKCGLWRDSIETCASGACTADCPNCLETFASDTLKVYSVPYYVRNSKLANSSYYDPANSLQTQKCDSAVDTWATNPGGEAAQATMEISDFIRTHGDEAVQIAEACSYVCRWVIERDEECRTGARNCGDLVVMNGQPMPYYLYLP